jgi:hypothetical protein
MAGLQEKNLGVWRVKLLDFTIESEEYEPYQEGDEIEVFKYHLSSPGYPDGSGYYEYRLVKDPNLFWMQSECEELYEIGLEENGSVKG